MKIVKYENMTSVYEMSEIEADVHWVFNRFLSGNDEVLYFVEKGYLKAVVSIGDLFKFLEKKKQKLWNLNYTSVLGENDKKAERFFLEHPTVHELPVVDANGFLTGVIRSGKKNPEHLLASFRTYAKQLYYGMESYYEKAASKFMLNFAGIVLIAGLPNDDKVIAGLNSDLEKEKFEEKRGIEPIEQLKNMTVQEEKNYWGDIFEPGISVKFVEEYTNINIVEKNGIKQFQNNDSSHYFTFYEGKRDVRNKNVYAKRKIYVVGPCTVFGSYVADDQTIEYYLQEILNDDKQDWQVVNLGVPGVGYEFQYLLTEPIKKDDIVVILTQNKNLPSIMKRYDNVFYLGEYSSIYEDIYHPISYVLDTFRHVNYVISEKIARRVYTQIEPYLNGSDKSEHKKELLPIQNYFIPWDVVAYYKEFALKYHLYNLKGHIGAIVMNCNPFTKGHRYLIEYAASKVDTLIVFVVEEDASAFSFQDRLEMVELGVSDIKNVVVVPSGKYNISKSTFAQYFEKEKKIDKIESMEYDVRIFCEVLADVMNISCRFVGEEPTDAVTRQYNQTMKMILPQYGLRLLEIPRLSLRGRGDKIISASDARELIKCNKWEDASAYLPDTTVNYIRAKGAWLSI